jgi:hypothetical protein
MRLLTLILQFVPHEAYHVIFLVTQLLSKPELTSVPIADDNDGCLQSCVRVSHDVPSLKTTLTLV